MPHRCVFVAVYVISSCCVLSAQSGGSYLITTAAGNGAVGFSGDGGTATSAQVNNPQGLAVDSQGNLYIADSKNRRVREVTPSGVITTVSLSVPLNDLTGIAVDTSGNLYIGDTFTVHKVTPSGAISAVAGSGSGTQFGGDGGPATSAFLGIVSGLAIDQAGNLYIGNGDRVRKVAPNGIISTVAGGGRNSPGDGGPATSAHLGRVGGLAIDASGNLYIADLYFTAVQSGGIRKVTPSGIITTVAGGGTASPGDGGPATSATLGLGPPGNANVEPPELCRLSVKWREGVLR